MSRGYEVLFDAVLAQQHDGTVLLVGFLYMRSLATQSRDEFLGTIPRDCDVTGRLRRGGNLRSRRDALHPNCPVHALNLR